jgi:hypothetical protein
MTIVTADKRKAVPHLWGSNPLKRKMSRKKVLNINPSQ